MTALLAAVMAIVAADARAQTPGGGPSSAARSANGAEPAASVTTRTGHEVTVGIGGYNYIEPGDLRISIHGPKLSVEYTGTLALTERKHWFVEAGLRFSGGTVSYDGWCLPWLIRPDGRSANGYALGLGDASPCSFSGDADGYVDVRALVGKDLLTGRWGVSPVSGLGIRYLSNGTTGIADFRTDTYLYVPLGVTARTVASGHRVSVNAEYDILLRGRQTTRESQLGGGEIDATPTAPAFTIVGLTDLSFSQHRGWAVRAGAKYQLTRHWSMAPRFIHWGVSDSDLRFTTATFTVNGITVDQELGAIEPVNSTNEWSVNVGFHF